MEALPDIREREDHRVPVFGVTGSAGVRQRFSSCCTGVGLEIGEVAGIHGLHPGMRGRSINARARSKL